VDVYSFGRILFKLLAVNEHLYEELAAVLYNIAKKCAKDPKDRTQQQPNQIKPDPKQRPEFREIKELLESFE